MKNLIWKLILIGIAMGWQLPAVEGGSCGTDKDIQREKGKKPMNIYIESQSNSNSKLARVILCR